MHTDDDTDNDDDDTDDDNDDDKLSFFSSLRSILCSSYYLYTAFSNTQNAPLELSRRH